MICTYCYPQEISLARSYNIENVDSRFIPTYYHTQIFGPVEGNPNPNVRCTPTFHSQILRNGENRPVHRKTANATTSKRPESAKEVVYKNCSKAKKQDQFYNRRGNCCYRSNQLWYDSAKQDLFKKLECCPGNYSHDRKQIDLCSQSVFGGPTFQLCTCDHLEKQEQTQPIQNPHSPQDQQQKHEQTKVITQEPTIIPQLQAQEPIPPAKETKKSQKVQATSLPKKNSLKKTSAFNRTVVEGSPTFTVVRKRNW